MATATQFAGARTRQQPKGPPAEGTREDGGAHAQRVPLSCDKQEVRPLAAARVSPEPVALSEVAQRQLHSGIAYTWNILVTEIGSKPVVTRAGSGGGMGWKLGADAHTSLHTKYTTRTDPPHAAGDTSQRCIMTCVGKESIEEQICVHE